ncbi:MAG: hypothetical protein V4819_03085 [Verrucomicrobiota bacterium]
MSFIPHPFRSALLTCAAVTLSFLPAGAAEPARIVLQNGRSVMVSSVSLQGDKLVVNAAGEGFTQGQVIPIETVDHVFGERPVELNRGIALLLTGKPGDAAKLLEPILAAQRVTAKIPGTFWLEAARAALVAYAVEGNSVKVNDLGKEISDATPAQGIDPFVSLAKALMLPISTKASDREVAFRDLTTDNLPADVCAYASFYRANLLKNAKRSADAAATLKQDMETLEAYLMVPCLFPSGGMILNGVAELEASAFLTALGRREEAVALLHSSIRHSPGTSVAAEANKRLESSK